MNFLESNKPAKEFLLDALVEKMGIESYSYDDIKKEFEKYSSNKAYADSGKPFPLQFANLLIGKDAGGTIKIIKLENGRQTKPTEWFDTAEEATDYVIAHAKKGKYDNSIIRPVKG